MSTKFLLLISSLICLCSSCVHNDTLRNRSTNMRPTVNNRQDNYNEDQEKYIATFKSIISESGNRAEDYLISNSTYNLDRWVFSQKLKDMPKEKALVDSFTERHKFDTVIEAKKKNLSFLSPDVKNPKFVVFYSELIDGMIVAEVFNFGKNRHDINNINYESISLFNTSRNYLFIFEQNILKKTVIVEMEP